MGNPRGFLEVERKEAGYRPIHDRIHDFGEVEQTLNSNDRRLQASRCMDCGVPFCHWACPIGNKPPEWNDALYRGDWQLAYELLTETNDFPEFTGRICPALCEKACVLNLMEHEPTTNREDEAAIIEHAFGEDYVKPHVPERNGKKVAVVGAGPAGLTAATRLNQKGYTVTVYDAREDAGGLLRYGIPNFKLNKSIIDRRLKLLREEGIVFEFGVKLVDSKKKSADDKGEIAANIQNDPTLGKDKTHRYRYADSPRPEDSRTRPQGCVLRSGDALAAKPRARRTGVQPRRARQCQGQERAGHRWWRHRFRLYRHCSSPGCQERDADRDHAEAARGPR